MMLPTPPMTYLIVRQTRFALTSLETFFNAMFGFGHPGKFPQGRLRHRIGQIIVNLHHLLLVAVPGAYHHQRLLLTLLTPMGSGDGVCVAMERKPGKCMLLILVIGIPERTQSTLRHRLWQRERVPSLEVDVFVDQG